MHLKEFSGNWQCYGWVGSVETQLIRLCTARGTQDSFGAVGIRVDESQRVAEDSEDESDEDSEDDDGPVYEMCLLTLPEVSSVPLPSSLELSPRLPVVASEPTAAAAGAGAADETEVSDGPFACSDACLAAATKSGRVDMEPEGPCPDWAARLQDLILEHGEMVSLLSVVLGRMLDRWCNAGDGVTLREVLHPLASLHSQPWSQGTADSLQSIAQCMSEHWYPRFQEEAMRRDSRVDDSSTVAELFSTEFLSKVLGSFELNAVGLEVPSPVRDYASCLRRIAASGGDPDLATRARLLSGSIVAAAWRARAVRVLGGAPLGDDERLLRINSIAGDTSSDDESDGRASGANDTAEALLTAMAETDEFDSLLFPPIRGAGVFSGISMANHSCVPNAEVRYSSGCGHPDIVALRDIEPEEEVCISYCETKWPLERRRQFLQPYGFVCCCERCRAEE